MPPSEYMDMILVPAILHTPYVDFMALPLLVQQKMRYLLYRYIGAGWAGNTNLVRRADA